MSVVVFVASLEVSDGLVRSAVTDSIGWIAKRRAYVSFTL